MTIDRPIFFIGMPRSGTTIIHHALAVHHETGWVSNYSDKFPRSSLALGMPRLYSIPGFRNVNIGEKPQHQRVSRFNKFLPKPAEAYAAWSRWCGEKFIYSYLLGVEATAEEKAAARRGVGTALRLQGKRRFIAKFTGPLRIGYLRSIFPDAIFLHVVRDGRAVVNSLLNVGFWRDGGGLERPWWRDGLPEGWESEWEAAGRTPATLAAIQWRRVIETGLEEKNALPDGQYHEIRYEDWVRDPEGELGRMLDAAALPSSPKAIEYVRSGDRYANMNFKFLERFDPAELDALDRIMGDTLERFGYPRKIEAETA